MEMLIVTILVLAVAYIAFVVLFPKAIPEEKSQHTKDALQEIFNETQLQQEVAAPETVLKDSLEAESPLVRGFFGLPLLKDLYPLALQAGMQAKADAVVVMYFAATLVLFVLANLLEISLLFAPLIALIGAYFLVKKNLNGRIKKRNAKFIDGFPDVLDMFVRSVKSGFPVTTAFKMVAENTQSPIREEFQQIVSELAIGQNMNQSLTRLAQRINEPDIHFFVVVMKVQQETGGNLAEVVTNLSNVIRKRKQLRLKVKAMTSEGRATSMILGGLPVFVFLALTLLNPDYVSVLWTTTAGYIALGGAGLLVFGAVFIVNKMVAIDI